MITLIAKFILVLFLVVGITEYILRYRRRKREDKQRIADMDEQVRRYDSYGKRVGIDHGRIGGDQTVTANYSSTEPWGIIAAGGYEAGETSSHSHVTDHFSGFGSDTNGGHFGGGGASASWDSPSHDTGSFDSSSSDCSSSD